MLEKSPGSPTLYLVRSVKKGQGEISVGTLDPGSRNKKTDPSLFQRQIAVEEGCDGLAGLRDLVVVVGLILMV